MKAVTISYKLKLKGYTLAKVAKEVGVSRQVAWEAVSKKRKGVKSDKVWKRIRQII